MNKIRYTKFPAMTLRTGIDDKNYKSMQWGCRNGNPRITVYTDKDIKDKDGKVDYNKVIISPFDLQNMTKFLNLCKTLLKSNKTGSLRVQCLYNKYEGRVKTKEIVVQSTVVFVKEATSVYFVIETSDKGTHKFELKQGDWHKYKLEGYETNIYQDAYVYIENLEKFIGNEVVNYLSITEHVEQEINEIVNPENKTTDDLF